jgi:hypothetical protein
MIKRLLIDSLSRFQLLIFHWQVPAYRQRATLTFKPVVAEPQGRLIRRANGKGTAAVLFVS